MPLSTSVSQPAITGATLEEADRLAVLDLYQVLHTIEEPEYDELTALAAELCEAPMATVSLLTADEQWFKARFGLSVTATPREHAFCAYSLDKSFEALSVEDATADPRFAANPFVTGEHHIRAYLGIPLKGAGDHVLGNLAVLDTEPRAWTERQVHWLRRLAGMVEAHLELRRALQR